MSAARNIRTRLAIVRRAEKMLKDINVFFDDAASAGFSVEEVDPHGEMVAIRRGLVAMLERERRLGKVPMEFPERTER